MSNNSNVPPPQSTGDNSEKKPEEESGGILDGLFGKSNNDKKNQEGSDKTGSEENKGGIMNMFSSDTKENSASGATEENKENKEEPGILSKISKGLGIGTDENKDAASTTTTDPAIEPPSSEIGEDASSQPNLPAVKENDASDANKKEGDSSFMDKVTGIFKPAAGEEDTNGVTGESSDETDEESEDEDVESTDDYVQNARK
jgi:hypothetical protein